jgi:hypothetical protein
MMNEKQRGLRPSHWGLGGIRQHQLNLAWVLYQRGICMGFLRFCETCGLHLKRTSLQITFLQNISLFVLYLRSDVV